MADGTKKVAIFLDGVLNTGSWETISAPFEPWHDGYLTFNAYTSSTWGSVVFDNLIIWDGAITDFSHRFKENPIPTIPLPGTWLLLD